MVGVAEHQHVWVVVSVASQLRILHNTNEISAEDDELIAQAKILYGCEYAGCDATKVELYEGSPEGLPKPPPPPEVTAFQRRLGTQ